MLMGMEAILYAGVKVVLAVILACAFWQEML